MLTEDIEDDRSLSLTHNILSAASDLSAIVAVGEVPQCQPGLQVNRFHLVEGKKNEFKSLRFCMVVLYCIVSLECVCIPLAFRQSKVVLVSIL